MEVGFALTITSSPRASGSRPEAQPAAIPSISAAAVVQPRIVVSRFDNLLVRRERYCCNQCATARAVTQGRHFRPGA
jgi:hypothetical protein